MTKVISSSSLATKQTSTIVFITFWSQFSSYALNAIMILFLTRPLLSHGLNYDQEHAYAFIGVTQATSHLIPILGGFLADRILGVRRAILIGSILFAISYLFIMLSGLALPYLGDALFIMAYALLPGNSGLLTGTTSAMVSTIYEKNVVLAKSAMTWYYMSINIGALLAIIIAPTILDSHYGPLSILTIAFIGKSIAALNFAKNYPLYANVIRNKDKLPLSRNDIIILIGYLLGTYALTLYIYHHLILGIFLISLGSACGILWFIIKTFGLKKIKRNKQLIASLLILEAIVFFVIYNQMNTTLILFAQNNSDLMLLGMHISAAQYQILNPLLILLLGTQLPKLYRHFPKFSIPYQFASGTLLASCGLLLMAYAASNTSSSLINGNYIGVTYILISLAELWISAIGLSMIGLYCDKKDMAFAMGVWYLAGSLSNTLSAHLAKFISISPNLNNPLQSLLLYKHYYLTMGEWALGLGFGMLIIAKLLNFYMHKRGVILL